MKQNVAMSLGVVALSVAGLVGVGSATAGAAPSQGGAVQVAADSHADIAAAKGRVTKVKVYEDANFNGSNTIFTENMKNLKKDGWNDKISSAKNLGNRSVTFYQHAGYEGAHFTLPARLSESKFSSHHHMHDSTTSVRFN